MLDRGFTTVRDAAGADYGLADAVREGYFVGPRVMFAARRCPRPVARGRPAARPRGARRRLLRAYPLPGGGRRGRGAQAVRDEIRKGAEHIKLMLGGGVASPTDRIDSTQFSVDEIRAAVQEATAANRYVLGHAYTSRGEPGAGGRVRSIEHGNLMDSSSIRCSSSTMPSTYRRWPPTRRWPRRARAGGPTGCLRRASARCRGARRRAPRAGVGPPGG